jgi:uncharacterized membrane protein
MQGPHVPTALFICDHIVAPHFAFCTTIKHLVKCCVGLWFHNFQTKKEKKIEFKLIFVLGIYLFLNKNLLGSIRTLNLSPL